MPIVVSPHNPQEEKVLLAFLKSLEYEFSDEEYIPIPPPEGVRRQTLEEYNEEIEQAVAEAEAGNFYTHEEVLKEMESWKNG